MKYRKRAEEIEAMQFSGTVFSAQRIFEWTNGATQHSFPYLSVKTSDGEVTARPLDFVVRVKDGYRVMGFREFLDIYDPVMDDS